MVPWILLPLDPDLLRLLAGRHAAARPAIFQLFLPQTARGRARARRIVQTAIEGAGLTFLGWRDVPLDPSVLGPAARATLPHLAQAIVARPDGDAPMALPRRASEAAFERRLVIVRRRIEAEAAGLAGFSIPSASSRTIVYKGLVSGERLAAFYLDLQGAVRLSHAVFHQRFATNTRPAWELAQPFRATAHNGEINTVRGNREQVRGRARDAVPGANAGVAAELVAAGPLVSQGGSDSLSLDQAIELLTTTGFSLPMAVLAVVPEALSLRPTAHPLLASFRRRTASLVAPWDGPSTIVFSDGRRVGAVLDRNGLRPLAFAVTRDRLVAAASEAGAVPITPAETVRRGRLGPGQMLLVDPGRGAILEDAEAKTAILRRLPIHDASRVAHDDTAPIAERSTPTAGPIRFLAGLDAERARLDIRTLALEGHEPLWSMGDDTPTPGRGRTDRRVADHLRQAFAQVTNPPIDPDRERVVMDLRVELGRRPALLGGLPRRPGTVRLRRPIVADLDGLLAALGGSVGTASGRVRTLDATWAADAGARGLEVALDRLAREAVAAARGRTRVIVLDDRGLDLGRMPIPSVLGVGAVHTALTDAGLRGRADVVAAASDVLDVHALAMALACGATAVHPWLAIELAAELAGSRGAEELSVERDRGKPGRRPRGGAAQDARADGHQYRGLVRGWRPLRSSRTRPRRRGALLPDGRRLAGTRLPRRSCRAPAGAPSCGPRAPRTRAGTRAPVPGSRARPVPRRRRGAPLCAEDRRGHAGRRRLRRRRSARSRWIPVRACPRCRDSSRRPADPTERAIRSRRRRRDPALRGGIGTIDRGAGSSSRR